jgi:RNA polymerase sigma factor (sigma-70 family)
MATSPDREWPGVLARLAHAAHSRDWQELTDGELLSAFLERRDESAFEALLCRHGRMVLGVCQRLLPHAPDAEDAFQATFLVLARKASSVSPRNLVGNWLYGVAQQTALQVRALNMKRQSRERTMANVPEAAMMSESKWEDLQPILDEELGRLPAKYRAVVMLCDVEGRTRKDAAIHLGCPEGSVSSRLSRAREMLSKRLTKRGVTLSAGTLGTMLTTNALAAAVPATLLSTTVKGACAGVVVSVIATQATTEVMKAMLLTKLKAMTGVVLLLALVGTGVVLAGRGAGDKPTERGEIEEKRPVKIDEIPIVKPPKKLARVPDPPDELRRVLAAWDDKYRHKDEERFLELEREAAELLKKYPESDNQARIYFTVAHVAGQSSCDKHYDRIEKYAREALTRSRDPIQRGWSYMYLSGTAQTSKAAKTFAERRRIAADVLLTSYAELLAQELPEKAPEPPMLNKGMGRDLEMVDPAEAEKIRVRIEAIQKARAEAVFIRELVDRRNTIIMQLQGLYRPSVYQ